MAQRELRECDSLQTLLLAHASVLHIHGCAVLLCLVVCLTLVASFFLPSHLSLKHVHV